MKTIPILFSFLIYTFAWALEKPNIVLIYADIWGSIRSVPSTKNWG